MCSCSVYVDEELREDVTNLVQVTAEEAYYEGQKDAIEGDIRIEKNQEGVYEWTKSCWDSGREPSFQPGKESVFVPEKETYKNRMKNIVEDLK